MLGNNTLVVVGITKAGVTLDAVDNDPVRLAARSLVERLRSEEYKGGTFFDGYGPVLDYVEAVDEVMAFLAQHHHCHTRV
jgi:hypothetical protein